MPDVAKGTVDLLSGQLTSDPLTHRRLKHFAGLAQTSEDIVSRIALGLSIGREHMPTDGWAPSPLSAEIEAPEDASITKGKVLKCKTLLKTEEDALLVRAVLQHRECMFPDQRTWRNKITEHWERGVQELTRIAAGEDDWVRIMAAVMDHVPANGSVKAA